MDQRIDTRDIITIPNLLSFFRIVLAGVFALVFYHARSGMRLYWAVGVLALSGLTDFADGKIARRFHMVSELGKVLDPIADKLLTTSMFLLFVSRGIIPVVPVIIMVARDTIVDGCRMVAATNGKVVAAGMMGKLKTVLQMVTVALVLLNNLPFELIGLPMSDILLWMAALVSMISGIQYFNMTKEDIMESK